jgi:hypothetical protein
MKVVTTQNILNKMTKILQTNALLLKRMDFRII